MRVLNTIGRYWRDKYGCKVYKIPISIPGFTCPNIDGKVAKGGCTFCENDSFAPNLKQAKTTNVKKLNFTSDNPYLPLQLSQLQFQFNTTKNKLKKKFGAKKFIVYFQSFTNTYAPFDTLKTLYDKALSFDDVVGLSIGTRADSVEDKLLQYLSKLNQEKEIWIEYGVQSVFDKTLNKINRAETWEDIKQMIIKTKKLNLFVCAHLIFGLPDEKKEQMLTSVKEVSKLNIDAIKIHPLYVVKKTALTKEYLEGRFIPISKEQYLDVLVEAIKLLPDNIKIQRLTAGINDDSLLSSSWCKCKHTQMKDIKEALLKNNIIF